MLTEPRFSRLLMLIVCRTLLAQQLFKLGVTQSSVFSYVKAAMPTATEALPGKKYYQLMLPVDYFHY